jgi:hypothetical protein
MCKAGDLPFKCSLSPIPRGTWHWLDIYSGDTNGHIVRTEDPTAFPEDTPNRQDARASNMPDLFETEDERIIRLSPPKLLALLPRLPGRPSQIATAFEARGVLVRRRRQKRAPSSICSDMGRFTRPVVRGLSTPFI